MSCSVRKFMPFSATSPPGDLHCFAIQCLSEAAFMPCISQNQVEPTLSYDPVRNWGTIAGFTYEKAGDMPRHTTNASESL